MTEEKCKQYIKLDGLSFCMSSVCPEKDCIYALNNKLHQKIDRLEQENKEIYENGQIEITKLCNEKTKYRSALEEIREIAYGGADVNDCSFCHNIYNKINEVLK